MDDPPSSSPWESTLRLSDGITCEAEIEYEHLARGPNYPPSAAISKAFAAAKTQDDPGLYDEDGALITDADVDYFHDLAVMDPLNHLASLVTCIDYQTPRRARVRIPSGPYRRMTDEERDEITQ